MNLTDLRLARGWTQAELAARLGVTPTTVYRWESGRETPRLSRIKKLARVLGTSIDRVRIAIEQP